jgi:phenylacetate-CoA ligase
MDNFDRIVTDPRLSRHLVESHVDGPDPGTLLLDEYRVAATGGTSGERGVFAYDHRSWLSVVANIVRVQRFLGVHPATRSIGIGAPSPIHLSYRFYAELRASRPGAPDLDVTMPVERVVEALNAYQPEALTTYPSFLRLLALEQQAGRLKISPRFMRSGAEMLLPEVRDLVTATWGVPTYNGYACTEAGVMAQECPLQEGMHLTEDLCVFEVVDDNYHDNYQLVPDGQPGTKLLVTTLNNAVLPLIRYELTDLVTLAPGPCACGMPYRRIASIEGRREEVLTFGGHNGEKIDVGAVVLKSPLIAMEGIKQFQLRHGPGELKVMLVLNPGIDGNTAQVKVTRTLRDALIARGVADPKLAIEIVDKIARVGSAAKEKHVIKASP